ncbi:MAG: hypothetical protein AAGF11_15015 [Myxococcota bacterium]
MSSITPVRDPVAEPVLALLDVFGAHAPALRFPEVDHATLEALAVEVREAAAEVARCEQALTDARRALDERHEALRTRAKRALAYAQIYAEDDATLRERLEAIELSPRRTSAKRGPKRNARRPPRARRTSPAVADESVTELPFSPDPVETARGVA